MVTTLGLIIGIVAMNISGAGWGVVIPAALEGGAPAVAQAPQTWQQIVLNLFPENIAQAVAQNQILQVAIFSILFGSALAMIPEPKRAPLVTVLQSLADVMFQLTRFIMYLAPLAAGAAIAYTVGSTGLATLLASGEACGDLLHRADSICTAGDGAGSCHVSGSAGPVCCARLAEPAAIGFATTTSEAALPLAMERMEEFGVPRWIVSFVIPTGYSFNMTGGSVYLSMAAVFVAQAAGIHLTFGRQIAVVLVSDGREQRYCGCSSRIAGCSAGDGERCSSADCANLVDSWRGHADGYGPDNDECGRQLHGRRRDRADGKACTPYFLIC